MKPNESRRLGAILPILLVLTVACGAGDRSQHDPMPTEGDAARANAAPAVSAELLLARAREAVADPLRPEEDRMRDADRRPAELLAFFRIGEGMRVADLQGTAGYYTELLSSVVGPQGRVYVQNNDFVLSRFAGEPLTQRLLRLKAADRINVERVDAEVDEMELPAGIDAAIFVRFYHDLFWLPTPDGDLADRAEFLRRVYAALKPGGVFGIVDHHAEPGSGARDAADAESGLHRIDVGLVKHEVLAAGFELEAESDLLSNPADTRDWNIFKENRRDKTDRFVLRFVKPRS